MPRYMSSSGDQKVPIQRPLVVLGLESSADDSCAAIVSSHRQILSNVVIKQGQLLQKFDGIHPLHAQEAHERNLPDAIHRALQEAQLKLDQLDAIAVTRGPGMRGCLSTCMASAKALAAAADLPLIGVHHMQAHALTPFLTEPEPPTFPFLTLLLSGGHTLMLLARSETDFEILATTHDESIGASLDKGSRELEIPLELGNGSAGAALEVFAFGRDATDTSSHRAETALLNLFPVPFPKQLAFSFSGTRSALHRILNSEPVNEMSEERRKELAKAFMTAAFKQIGKKVELGVRHFEREQQKSGEVPASLGALVVSGGVASNLFLRRLLRNKLDSMGYESTRLIFPPPSLCTDNAAMIAQVGLSRLLRGRVDSFHMDIKSKWSIEECESDFEK
ncbi:Mitochondrial tRNAs modification protein [Microbotryomycetes sp. JL221]|nr:Mitochondrial tRNAs modification protein [Microbotryomycetes sp. JL221]